MTDEPTRPSRSDIKPIYRRVLCAKCRGEHWHKLTGPYQWTCPNCGASFKQNPWVTDDHPIIEPPDYEGDKPCQMKRAQIATEPECVPNVMELVTASFVAEKDARTAKAADFANTAQITLESAMNAMVQASFL